MKTLYLLKSRRAKFIGSCFSNSFDKKKSEQGGAILFPGFEKVSEMSRTLRDVIESMDLATLKQLVTSENVNKLVIDSVWTTWKYPPLRLAVEVHDSGDQYGFNEGVDYLLEIGADPYILDSDGDNALHMSALANSYHCFRSILRRYPVCIKTLNMDKRNVLHLVILNNPANSYCIEVVIFFIRANATIDGVDRKGYTPLYCALKRHRWAVDHYAGSGHYKSKRVMEWKRLACVLIDYGACTDRVLLNRKVPRIPKWAFLFYKRRKEIRETILAILNLKRRSASLGRNGRDMLRLVGQHLWSTRIKF